MGGGVYYTKVLQTRELAAQLVSFLDYSDLAEAIGRKVLKTDPALRNVSLARVVDKILQNIDIELRIIHVNY